MNFHRERAAVIRSQVFELLTSAGKSFRALCESLGTELKRSVVLDGEIVYLDGDGKSLFYDLLFQRGEPILM